MKPHATLASLLSRPRVASTLRGLLLTVAAATAALACGWSLITDHSVRFNTFRTGRAFYRLPPLPIMIDPKTGKELSVRDVEHLYEDDDYEDPAEPVKSSPVETAWGEVKAAIEAGDLKAAEKHLRTCLSETEFAAVDGSADDQLLRNAAFDMLDALSNLRRGAKAAAVKQYLEARLAFTDDAAVDPATLMPDKAPKDLQDNWEYLRAAAFYRKDQKAEALDAFREHAAKYPYSEKRDAVEYMIAKLTMGSSYSFGNMNCGIMGKKAWGDEEVDPATVEPVEKCRDENWQAAVDAFKRFTRDRPNSRYANDARGWLAYLYRRGGQRAEALAEYYRLLGDPADRAARLEAKRSLGLIGHEYDDATLDKVEHLIADDRNAALAYAYHRIYNYAVDLSGEEFNRWCCYDEETRWDDEQAEKKRVTDTRSTGRHELERIARFASAMMERHPGARVSGPFVLRVAQAQLELGNDREARDLARKAISLGLDGDLRAEALWVEGSALHAMKGFHGARVVLGRLVAGFPNSKLIEGARRLQALAAEDMGDLEFALEQYLALDYRYDVAYYVDVLMPTDRLAGFVNTRLAVPQRDLLLYSLGLRYMRDGRWDDARIALRQVRTAAGAAKPVSGYGYETTTSRFVKDPGWDSDNGVIETAWVMQDLKAIDTLENLERAVLTADGDEARAEAMYQLASYQFDADELLFYNPAVWGGQRYWLLHDLDSYDRFRLPNESQTLFEYSQSHETLARAIPIYLDIVSRYPKTKAAPDALYTAAVAHQHLANLNPYWRSIYESGLYAGVRRVGYADLRSAYPRYQLPRGTNGWEASTRTVNGGPGWAPKPKPRVLTRRQKLERRLEYASDLVKLWAGPWVTSARDTVTSVFQGWTSAVTSGLACLLGVVAALFCAYLALLAVHFRHPLAAAARRISGAAVASGPVLWLRDPGSRVEKVIDQTNPGETED